MHAGEFSNILYAVIEVRWIGRPAERFAIAYQSEESLRTMIAAPSIIASGFFSSEEALAILLDRFTSVEKTPTSAAETTYNPTAKGDARELSTWQKRLGLTWFRTAAGHLLQQLTAALVIVVFSKSIFSASLRALIAG